MVDIEFQFDCAMPYFLYGRHVADVPFSLTIVGECEPNTDNSSWEIFDICYEDFEGDKHCLADLAFDREKEKIIELHWTTIQREFSEKCRKIDEEWSDTLADTRYEDYRDYVRA